MRRRLSQAERKAVYDKYNGHCAYCGCDKKAKKPDYDDYHLAGYRCPDCNNVNPWGYKHCKHCGQKLDWSDVE